MPPNGECERTKSGVNLQTTSPMNIRRELHNCRPDPNSFQKRRQSKMLNRRLSGVLGATWVLLLAAICIQTSRTASAQGISSAEAHRCDDQPRLVGDGSATIRRFSSSELMSRLRKDAPVRRPPVLGQSNIFGVASVGIVVNGNGRVVCTNPVRGNPIGLGAVERSVREWRFKPYLTRRKKRLSMSGTIEVPFDFRK